MRHGAEFVPSFSIQTFWSGPVTQLPSHPLINVRRGAEGDQLTPNVTKMLTDYLTNTSKHFVYAERDSSTGLSHRVLLTARRVRWDARRARRQTAPAGPRGEHGLD